MVLEVTMSIIYLKNEVGGTTRCSTHELNFLGSKTQSSCTSDIYLSIFSGHHQSESEVEPTA